MPYTLNAGSPDLDVAPSVDGGKIVNATDTNRRFHNPNPTGGASITLTGHTEADLIADGLVEYGVVELPERGMGTIDGTVLDTSTGMHFKINGGGPYTIVPENEQEVMIDNQGNGVIEVEGLDLDGRTNNRLVPDGVGGYTAWLAMLLMTFVFSWNPAHAQRDVRVPTMTTVDRDALEFNGHRLIYNGTTGDYQFGIGTGTAPGTWIDVDSPRSIEVLSAAPVDGTTVAEFPGQMFWDDAGEKLYRATTESVDPSVDGTGSVFAEVQFGDEDAAPSNVGETIAAGGYTVTAADAGKMFVHSNATPANAVVVSVNTLAGKVFYVRPTVADARLTLVTQDAVGKKRIWNSDGTLTVDLDGTPAQQVALPEVGVLYRVTVGENSIDCFPVGGAMTPTQIGETVCYEEFIDAPLAGSSFTLDNTTGGPSNAGVTFGTSQIFHNPDRQIFFDTSVLPKHARIKSVSMFEERRGNNTAAVRMQYGSVGSSSVNVAAHGNGYSATRSTTTFATSQLVDPAVPLILVDPSQNHWDYAPGADADFIASITPGTATASGGANDGVTTSLTGFNAIVEFELSQGGTWYVRKYSDGTVIATKDDGTEQDVTSGIPAGWTLCEVPDAQGTVVTATEALTTTNGVDVAIGDTYILHADGTTFANLKQVRFVESRCYDEAGTALTLDNDPFADEINATQLATLPAGAHMRWTATQRTRLDTLEVNGFNGTVEISWTTSAGDSGSGSATFAGGVNPVEIALDGVIVPAGGTIDFTLDSISAGQMQLSPAAASIANGWTALQDYSAFATTSHWATRMLGELVPQHVVNVYETDDGSTVLAEVIGEDLTDLASIPAGWTLCDVPDAAVGKLVKIDSYDAPGTPATLTSSGGSTLTFYDAATTDVLLTPTTSGLLTGVTIELNPFNYFLDDRQIQLELFNGTTSLGTSSVYDWTDGGTNASVAVTFTGVSVEAGTEYRIEATELTGNGAPQNMRWRRENPSSNIGFAIEGTADQPFGSSYSVSPVVCYNVITQTEDNATTTRYAVNVDDVTDQPDISSGIPSTWTLKTKATTYLRKNGDAVLEGETVASLAPIFPEFYPTVGFPRDAITQSFASEGQTITDWLDLTSAVTFVDPNLVYSGTPNIWIHGAFSPTKSTSISSTVSDAAATAQVAIGLNATPTLPTNSTNALVPTLGSTYAMTDTAAGYRSYKDGAIVTQTSVIPVVGDTYEIRIEQKLTTADVVWYVNGTEVDRLVDELAATGQDDVADIRDRVEVLENAPTPITGPFAAGVEVRAFPDFTTSTLVTAVTAPTQAIDLGVDLSEVDFLDVSITANGSGEETRRLDLSTFVYDADQGGLLHWWDANGIRVRINTADLSIGRIYVAYLNTSSMRIERIQFRKLVDTTLTSLHRTKLVLAADTALATATTTQLPFDTVEYDVGGIADLPNNQVVIQSPGLYDLDASIFNINQNRVAQLFINVNGNLVARNISSITTGDQTLGYSPQASTKVELDQGDVVTVDYYAFTATTTSSAMTQLTVTQLSTNSTTAANIPTEAIEAHGIVDDLEVVAFENIEVRFSSTERQAQIRATTGTIPLQVAHTLQTGGTTEGEVGTYTIDQTWRNLDIANESFFLSGSVEKAHVRRTDTGVEYAVEARMGDTNFDGNSILIRRLGQKAVINTTDIAVTQSVVGGVMIEERGIFTEMHAIDSQVGASRVVTFPQPFAAGETPIVQLTPDQGSAATATLDAAPTATGFTFTVRDDTGNVINSSVHWAAKALAP